jgi:hypothetical protein
MNLTGLPAERAGQQCCRSGATATGVQSPSSARATAGAARGSVPSGP